MERVLDLRTQSLTVVLEDVFQPHNASAAVRSCECFGIQDVHIVEGKFPYRLNKDVVLGASKWIELHRYGGPGVDHTRVCLDRIKGEGFAIAATTLSNDAVPIDQLNVSQNLALCFGSEEDGLSDTAMNLADLLVKIPMFGFTQSLNLSVSVAVCLYQITQKIRHTRTDWHLTPAQRRLTHLSWLRKSIRNAHLIEKQFLARRDSGTFRQMNG